MIFAICDDDKEQLNILIDLLENYQSASGETMKFDVFQNGLDLMAALQSRTYDALLLDILMPGFNGIEAAKEIRGFNEKLPIIFLTSSPEFAVESYRVHAFDYLLKPVDQVDFYKTLDRICLHKHEQTDTLTIQVAKAIYVLPLSQIEFLEVSNRTLFFHLSDGSEKVITGRLYEYEETLLKHPQFLKVHRSFIINMDLMKALDKQSFLTLSGRNVPISRNLLQSIQKTYMDYLHMAIRLSN